MKNLIGYRKSVFLILVLIFYLAILLTSCEYLATILDLDEDDISNPIISYNESSQFSIRRNWCFASKPYNSDLPNGKLNYFNPGDFYAIDVYEDSLLTEEDESLRVQNLRNKLMVCPIANPGYSVNSWSGIMQHLEEPIDITEIEYIEFQILENADVFPDVPVTIHLDIGLISEDFFRPGESSIPDREDSFEYNGELDAGEDIGLDGIHTGEPGDLPDDDYSNDRIYVNDYEEYPEINGTEGNCRLDTEDLNNNGALNLTNAYIHYSFSLDCSDYISSINSKGLRTYRIPSEIYEVVMDSIIEPDLQDLRYIRLWFEYPEETYVVLVAMDFVDLDIAENTIRLISPNSIIPNSK